MKSGDGHLCSGACILPEPGLHDDDVDVLVAGVIVQQRHGSVLQAVVHVQLSADDHKDDVHQQNDRHKRKRHRVLMKAEK